ncbi:hypothetical protein SVIRM249S_06155 [Streptomyces viridochromogenes]
MPGDQQDDRQRDEALAVQFALGQPLVDEFVQDAVTGRVLPLLAVDQLVEVAQITMEGTGSAKAGTRSAGGPPAIIASRRSSTIRWM